MTIAAAPSDTDRLLDFEEVCAVAKVSANTLRRWVQAGTFPQPVIQQRRFNRWRRSDIQAWFEGLGAGAPPPDPPPSPAPPKLAVVANPKPPAKRGVGRPRKLR